MIADGRYRNELKYSVSYADYLALRQRLLPIMKTDGHTLADGRYTVRSIYFDNLNDKVLREKTDGVSKREKFRIRYYNDDFSFITLEKKMKYNNLCMKLDARLTEEECRMILDGRLDFMLTHSEPLVRELYTKMKYSGLRPRVLVSYTREPYIFAAGNVRVTFDFDIRTTLWHNVFLEQQVHDIGAADAPGQIILEIKYDDYLPDIIRDLVQSESERQQAFSKYCVARRFG